MLFLQREHKASEMIRRMIMNKNENVITMGSSIIDFYMEGFDEGKHDNDEIIVPAAKGKKKQSAKVRASARRKKTYYKSQNRMKKLSVIGHYTPSAECENVVQGILRSHQLPLDSTYDQVFGCSIGNKKRQDTADQKMVEAMRYDYEDASVI
jgi:hypothetical protein